MGACQAQPSPQIWTAASALSLSPDGALLAAVNPDSDSVTLIDPHALAVLAEIPVGDDPRSAAFTPDGGLLLVANRGSGSLSLVDPRQARVAGEIVTGGQPYGVVSAADRAYASLSAMGAVAVLDLAERRVLQTIPVDPAPAGLALAGRTLYVTHLYAGRVTPIDLSRLSPDPVIELGGDANLSQSIALSPDGARAFLPVTRSNSAELDLAHNTTVFPSVAIVDLQAGLALGDQRVDLDLAGPPVNLPFAAAVSPDGRTLYVANAGSDDVSIIDLATRRAAAQLRVGRNPRGVSLSLDGARLFVNNTLDGSLSVFSLGPEPALIQTLRLTSIPLSDEVLAGKRLFNSALPPMSRDGRISCASCHLDGGHDGRTWLGFPGGPRNTPALFGAAATLPLHWTGDLDELQDVELTVRHIQFGTGLLAGEAGPALGPAHAGRSTDLDALAAYLASLPVPASPHAFAPETLERGERAFRRWGCAACHAPPLYTDQRLHRAATGGSMGQAAMVQMDTPALAGLWASAPYFHDGSAATLRETLFKTGFHGMGFAMDAAEVDDLLAFLLALPAAP